MSIFTWAFLLEHFVYACRLFLLEHGCCLPYLSMLKGTCCGVSVFLCWVLYLWMLLDFVHNSVMRGPKHKLIEGFETNPISKMGFSICIFMAIASLHPICFHFWTHDKSWQMIAIFLVRMQCLDSLCAMLTTIAKSLNLGWFFCCNLWISCWFWVNCLTSWSCFTWALLLCWTVVLPGSAMGLGMLGCPGVPWNSGGEGWLYQAAGSDTWSLQYLPGLWWWWVNVACSEHLE